MCVSTYRTAHLKTGTDILQGDCIIFLEIMQPASLTNDKETKQVLFIIAFMLYCIGVVKFYNNNNINI